MSRWSFLREEAKTAAQASTMGGAAAAVPAPTSGEDWRVTTLVREHDSITDLKSYGFRSAGSSNASPEVLKAVIGWLYNNKLTVDDMHASGEYERISAISEQLVEAEGELSKAKHKCAECERKLTKEHEKLATKKADLAAVRAGDGTLAEVQGLSDRVSFFIAAAILVVLTLYLFLFYVSAIYNAFLFDPAKAAEEGLRTGHELSITIFNGEAFQKAWASGMMTFLFVASAPSIVLGMGFLIHHFQRMKRTIVVWAIITVTLMFDALIAYEIVAQIHRIKVLTGELSGEYTIATMLKSAEFWIIVMAGFVVYIIWGFILQAVLDGLEKFHPARVAERKLRQALVLIDDTCTSMTDALSAVRDDVAKLEAECKILNQKRSPREMRNNVFGRHVDELMQGWQTYLAQAFSVEVHEKQVEAETVRLATVKMLTGVRA